MTPCTPYKALPPFAPLHRSGTLRGPPNKPRSPWKLSRKHSAADERSRNPYAHTAAPGARCARSALQSARRHPQLRRGSLRSAVGAFGGGRAVYLDRSDGWQRGGVCGRSRRWRGRGHRSEGAWGRWWLGRRGSCQGGQRGRCDDEPLNNDHHVGTAGATARSLTPACRKWTVTEQFDTAQAGRSWNSPASTIQAVRHAQRCERSACRGATIASTRNSVKVTERRTTCRARRC